MATLFRIVRMAPQVNVKIRVGYLKERKWQVKWGGTRVTKKNLEVVRIDLEKDLILIKGAVPGAPGGDVFVRPTNASEINLPVAEEESSDDAKSEDSEMKSDKLENE